MLKYRSSSPVIVVNVEPIMMRDADDAPASSESASLMSVPARVRVSVSSIGGPQVSEQRARVPSVPSVRTAAASRSHCR